MKIIVKAKTRAKKAGVERVGQPALDFGGGGERQVEMVSYKVSVTEAPVAGKANLAIVRALAEYFDVPVGNVRLVVGQRNKHKVFEIIQGS